MTAFKVSFVKPLAAAVAAVSLCLPVLARAADVSVGFVNVERALDGADDWKKAAKELESFAKKKQEELRPQEEEFKRRVDEFKSQQSLLDPNKLRERQIELQQLENKYKRAVEDAQESVEAQKEKMLRPILQKVESAIQAVGKEKGITIIMNQKSPGLLYFQDAFDITDVVIAKVNE